MNKQNTFSVLISGDDPDFQFRQQVALNEIDESIEIEFLYNCDQLLEYLQKDQLQRDLNRQHLPHVILADLKNPYVELARIREIKSNDEFRKVPIYLFAENADEILVSKALEFGASRIFKKPFTFLELKEVLQTILDDNFPGVFGSSTCCRCDDELDQVRPMDDPSSRIKLNSEEIRFIEARFEGNLCPACLNQLKTSYKIIHGDFNSSSDKVTSKR